MGFYAFSSKKADDQKIMQLLPKAYDWVGGRDRAFKKGPISLHTYVKAVGKMDSFNLLRFCYFMLGII